MQYTRRRILRVSGVTVRDERLERREFTAASPMREHSHEEWDEFLAKKNDDTPRRRPLADWDKGADWDNMQRGRT